MVSPNEEDQRNRLCHQFLKAAFGKTCFALIAGSDRIDQRQHFVELGVFESCTGDRFEQWCDRKTSQASFGMGPDIDICTGANEFTLQHRCGKARSNAALRCGAPGFAGKTYFSPCWTNSMRLRRLTLARSLDFVAKLHAILRRIDALISVLLMPSSPSRLRNANGSDIVDSTNWPCSIWSSKLTNLSMMTMSWLFI